MITIKEMAEMLGISTTTVSNVINGKTSEVSQKTAEKVQKLLAPAGSYEGFEAANGEPHRVDYAELGIIHLMTR